MEVVEGESHRVKKSMDETVGEIESGCDDDVVCFTDASMSMPSEASDIRNWYPSYVYESLEESSEDLEHLVDSGGHNGSETRSGGSMFKSRKLLADPNSRPSSSTASPSHASGSFTGDTFNPRSPSPSSK